MEKQGGGGSGWSPVGAPPPLLNGQTDNNDHWRHFDNSVNAVSFGFVATAILISMFLVMAIFERFFRPNSGRNAHGDVEAQTGFNPKLGHPSPKMTVYANGVSVLMPGDNVPTFIAHPAPVSCPPKGSSSHQQQHQPSHPCPDRPADSNSTASSSSANQEPAKPREPNGTQVPRISCDGFN